MFLLRVEASDVNSVEIELEGSKLEIDPRPIIPYLSGLNITMTYIHTHCKTIATITKPNYDDSDACSDDDSDDGWLYSVYFRVYDPAKEVIPSFISTTYNYQGLAYECAPRGIVRATIDKSAKVIHDGAFIDCCNMETCEMHEGIEEIHDRAFEDCHALTTIKLPRNLKRIGNRAFYHCNSLDAIFVPPRVEEIGNDAFYDCHCMGILSLPPNMTVQMIGKGAFHDCALIRMNQEVQHYIGGFYDANQNCEEVHQSIIDFYDSQPPLHKACLDTSVSAQTIRDCFNVHGAATAFITDHNEMTPLHILAMNPYATPASILACLELNINSVLLRDNVHDNVDPEMGMTVMDYLWKYKKLDCLISLVQALSLHREANLKQDCIHGSKRQRVR